MSAVAFGSEQIASLELRDFLGRYISSGNPVIDMIIGVLVFRLIIYMSSIAEVSVSSIGHNTGGMLSWLLNFGSNRHKAQLDFEWRHEDYNSGRTAAQSDIPPGYKAVVHRISTIPDDSVKQLRELTVQSYDDQRGRYNNESLYECLQDVPVEVEPGVFARVQERDVKEQTRQGAENCYIVREATVYSDVLTAVELKALVEKWIEEYNEFKKLQIAAQQLIFQVRFKSGGAEDIVYSDFHSFRNFDNLHFEGKEEVMNEIDFFCENESWYAERGLPYTLGILCHGPPGCGKTSFLKSLMAKTKRHAVVFSINSKTDLKSLDNLMRSDKILEFPIPQEDRIYVLEDIDAMGDLVKDRSEKEKTEEGQGIVGPKTLTEAAFGMGVGGFRKNKKKKKKNGGGGDEDSDSSSDDDMLDFLLSGKDKKSENHLGFLLNVIDGVVEIPGRIMVMTTNYVNKLDKALIRPGRIDVRLEFGNFSYGILQKIVGQFYEVAEEKVIIPPGMPERSITPAKIAQLCRGNKRDLDAALLAIEKECYEARAKEEQEAAKKERRWNNASSPDLRKATVTVVNKQQNKESLFEKLSSS